MDRLSRIVFTVSVFVIALLFCVDRTANAWDIQVVEPYRYVGGWSSIAIDANNRPHISYDNFYRLKYASWNGSAWVVETIDSVGDTGHRSSLTLDQQGRPHISYIDTQNNLHYATKNGAEWQTNIIDQSFYHSIAVDANGNPSILYSSSGELRLRSWDGTSWMISTVDTFEDRGSGCASIAIDNIGITHISYYDLGSEKLKYAKWNGTSWDLQVIADVISNDGENTLKLDVNGNPHITYYDGRDTSLKYATWDGLSWVIETVDAEQEAGRYHSLALDGNGNPYISYYRQDEYVRRDTSLWFASRNGSTWQKVLVDSGAGGIGIYNSLALDSRGNPYISYLDDSNYLIKVATVPEPSTVLALFFGIGGIIWQRRK